MGLKEKQRLTKASNDAVLEKRNASLLFFQAFVSIQRSALLCEFDLSLLLVNRFNDTEDKY